MYLLICNDKVNSENNFNSEFDARLQVLNEIARIYGPLVVEDFMDAILRRDLIKLNIPNYGEVEFQMK